MLHTLHGAISSKDIVIFCRMFQLLNMQNSDFGTQKLFLVKQSAFPIIHYLCYNNFRIYSCESFT
jgi:hypothetical protein